MIQFFEGNKHWKDDSKGILNTSNQLGYKSTATWFFEVTVIQND